MIKLNMEQLNPLEVQIYDILLAYSKSHPKFRINQAATLCGCSESKISKFVKKLGFANFKQYLEFLYGSELPVSEQSNELARIDQFIETFDPSLVEELLELILTHDKIVFFGYGPSLLCAQYFEYRLRTCSNKMAMSVSDEISVSSLVDENTLLIILTVTGTFHSFETVCDNAKRKGCEVAMVVEEYNTDLFDQCDKIFWLAKTPQPNDLKAYEKSRTIFFVFLEEVIQRILHHQKA